MNEQPEAEPDGRAELPTSLRSLYRAHWRELVQYIQRTFGSGPPEPEDVAQIVFARYAALEDPTSIRNPRAFLYASARNFVFDQKRGQRCVEQYVEDVLARAGEEGIDQLSPERVAMQRQRFEILNEAIKGLPLKQQRVLAMNRYHGMTYQQIAARTGWSLADISRQVARAIATLEGVLGAREDS